jgi:hypothetical protein
MLIVCQKIVNLLGNGFIRQHLPQHASTGLKRSAESTNSSGSWQRSGSHVTMSGSTSSEDLLDLSNVSETEKTTGFWFLL